MNKIFFIIVSFFLSLSLFSCNISTKETELTKANEIHIRYSPTSYDSVYVSQYEQNEIRNSYTDSLVKVYFNFSAYSEFSQGSSIFEVTRFAPVAYIVESDNGKVMYKNIHNLGGTVEQNSDISANIDEKFFLNALYPKRIFDFSVDIYNVYCLNITSDIRVGLIYFVTSDGDFILYNGARKELGKGATTYLFKKDDFYNICQEVCSEIDKEHTLVDKAIDDILSVQKLNKYIFSPQADTSKISSPPSNESEHPQKLYDSVTLSDTERNNLSVSSLDKVVKLYGMNFFDRFGERDTILNIASTPDNISYMIVSNDGYTYYTSLLDLGGYTNEKIDIKGGQNLYVYALQPEKVFAPSVEIYNTYCIVLGAYEITSSHSFNANYQLGYNGEGLVYFSTSVGDYVLYFPDMDIENSERRYLFPIEYFYHMIEDERAYYKQKLPYGVSALDKVRTAEELAEYKFKPLTLN